MAYLKREKKVQKFPLRMKNLWEVEKALRVAEERAVEDVLKKRIRVEGSPGSGVARCFFYPTSEFLPRFDSISDEFSVLMVEKKQFYRFNLSNRPRTVIILVILLLLNVALKSELVISVNIIERTYKIAIMVD